MTKRMARNSRKTPLRQAAEEFVKDHTVPRSRPRDRALMRVLSQGISEEPAERLDAPGQASSAAVGQ
jgi:hypothetical protein